MKTLFGAEVGKGKWFKFSLIKVNHLFDKKLLKHNKQNESINNHDIPWTIWIAFGTFIVVFELKSIVISLSSDTSPSTQQWVG